MASALPRFTGPAQARQRMRLIAALGMLAIAAITTGGLASLAAGRPVAREQEQVAPKPSSAEFPPIFDPARRLEEQVEAAEQAAERARAMIREERRRGLVDRRLLDELERRLDATGVGAGTTNENGTRERVPVSQPRAL